MTTRSTPEIVIDGVEVVPLKYFNDPRGWLAEFYRDDEISVRPVMGYVSLTHAGVARGPHEHRDQADVFVFMGPSDFRVFLWDNRPAAKTFGRVMRFEAGAAWPARVVVPAGVVHAYKNVGSLDGLVINCPDRLYAGPGRRDPVDEIRWEDDTSGRFVVD
jgi:dTDP-4-dehydrorhamnose 3,5-epimerase